MKTKTKKTPNMLPRDANHAIMQLLRERHRDEVYDGEVTTGSHGRRLDFLAIACSWAKPHVIGYEVKVDRRDFVQDDKWPAYLDSCKQLIFVTRAGIASIGEIPDQCGWQELSKNGKRLLTRKKAPARVMKPEDEARLYKLILMRRLGRGHEDPVAFWQRWLATRREERALGRLLRYEVATTVAAQLDKARREAKQLATRCDNLEAAKGILAELGIDPDHVARLGTWDLRRTLRAKIEAEGAGPVLNRGKDALKAVELAGKQMAIALQNFEHEIASELAKHEPDAG